MKINDLMREGYEQAEKKQGISFFLSGTFKLWVVALIFLLIFLHLYTIVTFPQTDIISNEVVLSVALVLIAYLWVQELRDRTRLQLLNKVLIDAGKKLQRAEIDTITVLVLTLEAKDPYVRGHSKRVARDCLAMAKQMGFSKEQQTIIERAGILHDLGKLSIVDDILQKTGKLTDEEWEIMKKHPRKSVEILGPLEFLFKEKEVILYHHERYDGRGYPGGLKGEEIPIESRLMAVADTFDAMNSERAYRKSLSKDAIVSELKRVSGSQLDASVVAIFLKLLERNPGLWSKD